MARAVMIQGTGSGVGKSLIAAGLCRIFRDRGINVAPFKAQNMALNSFITIEGGEIGRAQALQARAAGLEPSNDMNPVLLKASGESGSQVIIHGRVHSTMKAREYYAFRERAWAAVTESFDRLSKRHDLIVIEGAGSPAEINLMDVDIVNMSIAKYASSPVLLVGDIDRGGVFASLYGTLMLLGDDSSYIRGFIINKFRGDLSILEPGLDMLKGLTGRPVIGVLPYIHRIGLSEEDGLALSRSSAVDGRKQGKAIKIIVVRLPFISNFTDFDPFGYEPDVELSYSTDPVDILSADIVIVPGTKNTIKDLLFMKESGIAECIVQAASDGIEVIGVCGGYQMLGKKIRDPLKVESPHVEIEGIGLLDVETIFDSVKTTCRVEAEIRRGQEGASQGAWSGLSLLNGYEIHMGRTTGDVRLFKIKRLGNGSAGHGLQYETVLDGSAKGNVWGTYIHGLFENDGFRRMILNRHRIKKGLVQSENGFSYAAMQEKAIDSLAEVLLSRLDMDFIFRTIGL